MKQPQQIDHEFFQTYGELQEEAPLISRTRVLIEEFREKMPDELIEPFLVDRTGQQEPSSPFDYSITHNTPLVERKKAPVFFIQSEPSGERSVSLQKWQGIVLRVNKDTFIAKLVNITDKGYDEEAEFDYTEVTEEDLKLVRPGAMFYWSIGYSHSITGQRRRFSDIRFRRLPVLGDKQIEVAKRDARHIKRNIGWE
jgi:hypothetical protein